MESDDAAAAPMAETDEKENAATLKQALPEIECYLHLLVLIFLLDGKQLEKV